MIEPIVALLRLQELESEHGSLPETEEVLRLQQVLSPRLRSRLIAARRRHPANPIVPVERGSCTGCHVQLPKQKTELAPDVYHCESCSRVLYDPEVAFEHSLG